MLDVFFFNVGDGDAILLRERRAGERNVNVLVDCGRPFVEPKEGSFRKEAVYFLKMLGIDRLDRMYLTHLHIDHVGGALRILNVIPTDAVYALYFPPRNAGWVSPSFTSTDKTSNGLRHMLNIFRDVTDCALAHGCALAQVKPETERITERLSVTPILPREEIRKGQERVFDALYRNEPTPYGDVFRAAKQRNLSSVMLRFRYAGKEILLTGDRYAADWENEDNAPCDVLKLPHHGDPKSLTEKLLHALSPRYAVISCQSDSPEGKDRPNVQIVRMLQEKPVSVLCTENRELETLTASSVNDVRITIGDDGSIACETE